MNLVGEKIAYKALKDVFIEKAYSTIIINKHLAKAASEYKALATAIFYGVLENSIKFDYILEKGIKKTPKTSVLVLLKIGLYFLRCSNLPPYAAVDKAVRLSKEVGKGGVSGFINASLKKSEAVVIPSAIDAKTLSINASLPLDFVSLIVEENGFEFASALLLHNSHLPRVHIRPTIKKEDFEKKYPFLLQNSENATQFGYYVTHSQQNKLNPPDFVIQSLSSIRAVDFYLRGISPNKILDACAAPGGKSVLIKSLFPDARVVSCDFNPTRLKLIEAYSKKQGVELEVMQADATVFNKDFENAFDLVVCDVPCSGSGVYLKKPEIVYNFNANSIKELSQRQLSILLNCSRYVKKGGRLSYSTCSILKLENDYVVKKFLSESRSFSICGEPLKIYPHIDNSEGFFVANFIKNK